MKQLCPQSDTNIGSHYLGDRATLCRACDSHVQSLEDNLEDNALNVQVDGDHYKDLLIQPVQYIHANNIGYFEGNVIKYITRYKNKNGLDDLKKARHYIDLLIELEYGGENARQTN